MNYTRGSKRRHVLWKNVDKILREIIETSGVNLDLFPLPVVSLLTTEALKKILQVKIGLQVELVTG